MQSNVGWRHVAVYASTQCTSIQHHQWLHYGCTMQGRDLRSHQNICQSQPSWTMSLVPASFHSQRQCIENFWWAKPGLHPVAQINRTASLGPQQMSSASLGYYPWSMTLYWRRSHVGFQKLTWPHSSVTFDVADAEMMWWDISVSATRHLTLLSAVLILHTFPYFSYLNNHQAFLTKNVF